MNYARRVFKYCAFLLSVVVIMLQITACLQPSDNTSGDTGQSDTNGLSEKIVEAEELHGSVIGSHDGTDVDEDRHWVSHNSHWELGLALEDAVMVHENLEAFTKDEIELAMQRLVNAINAIKDEKQPGTKSPPVIDKSALAETIAEANTKMEGIEKSNDGLDIPNNGKWVSAVNYDALQSAIALADALNEKETATQEEIDAMVTDLNTAINAFVPQTALVNRTSLMEEITRALELFEDVDLQESVDGNDVHKSREWVTPSAKSEFEGAIAAASSMYIKSNANQNEINTALQNLKNASDEFDNGKEFGRNEIERYYLNKAIENAKSKLGNVEIAENGLTVLNSLNWVTQGMFDALKAVCEEAEDLSADDHAVQEDVDAMVTVLTAAVNAFNPQPGLLTAGGISYIFNQPQDENIVLPGTQTLSWIKNDKLQITVNGSYDSYQWIYIDGSNVIQNVTGNSLTIYARNFGVGTYSITLKVTKNSVPYTKTLTFNVE